LIPERMVAEAIEGRSRRAKDVRWLVVGVVTAYAANRITATIDGTSISNIRRCSTWTTPLVNDVALFGVIRGTSSVTYVGIDRIIP
jgi:hypothetical protein